jgi:hypothetical protein
MLFLGENTQDAEYAFMCEEKTFSQVLDSFATRLFISPWYLSIGFGTEYI